MSRSLLRASLASFLIGGSAGFLAGILFAPDEGRQVRQRVAYLLERWSSQVGGLVERIGQGDASESEARQTADALVADARAQAQQLLSEADALISQARRRRADQGGAPPLRRAS